ncbi:hypothetical protein GJU41_00145 [Bacillus idriensis]|uniref:Uncharacterized protein n=1 Tax=Metabacillus idriensis TaxID=324768 RepID=A0A6I2M2S8_9BACI|nr:hypothetical protein [Metabacillus idriensis]MRX52365.1 hypothetical protein [Metabacillus idriensis]
MKKGKVADLFFETKIVVAEYQEEAFQLDEQGRELKAELEALQEQHTANLIAQENASVSERVYLKIESKGIIQKSEVIGSLLEELENEHTELKLKFTPILQEALRKDRMILSQYDVTELAIKYRYLLLTEIAEIGKEMQGQYHAIAPDVMEIFEDPAVKEANPRLEYSFHADQFKPGLSWFDKSVVSKNELFAAVRGNLPQHLATPKDVK